MRQIIGKLFLITAIGIYSTLFTACASKSSTSTVPIESPTVVSSQGNSQQKVTSAENVSPRIDYICKRDLENRALSIESTEPKGCKLWYSNHDKKKPIAWSKNGLEYCSEICNKIQKNLTTAGFSCQKTK